MTVRFNIETESRGGYQALASVEAYLRGCGVEHKLLELVKMRVSQINGCAFCLHMHSEDARKQGETEARLHLLPAWHESQLYSARERAALAWAESLTDIARTHAPDEVHEQARAHFSAKELSDLTIAIAMINSWNRLAIAARTIHPSDRRST